MRSSRPGAWAQVWNDHWHLTLFLGTMLVLLVGIILDTVRIVDRLSWLRAYLPTCTQAISLRAMMREGRFTMAFIEPVTF